MCVYVVRLCASSSILFGCVALHARVESSALAWAALRPKRELDVAAAEVDDWRVMTGDRDEDLEAPAASGAALVSRSSRWGSGRPSARTISWHGDPAAASRHSQEEQLEQRQSNRSMRTHTSHA
jgi:hypothetical protein